MKVGLFAFVSCAVLATGIGLTATHPESLAARQRDDALRMLQFPHDAHLESRGWPPANVPFDPILKLHVDALSEDGVAWIEAHCVKDGYLRDTKCVLEGSGPMAELADRTELLQAAGFLAAALGGIMALLSLVFWRLGGRRAHAVEIAEV